MFDPFGLSDAIVLTTFVAFPVVLIALAVAAFVLRQRRRHTLRTTKSDVSSAT